jgi:hypothetical protein
MYKHKQLTCIEIRFCCKLQQFYCPYYSTLTLNIVLQFINWCLWCYSECASTHMMIFLNRFYSSSFDINVFYDMILFVCVGVMYSDEYIDIKGTRLSSKISPTPSDFVAQLLPAVCILIVRAGKKNFLHGSITWKQKFPADQRSIFVLNLHAHKYIVL